MYQQVEELPVYIGSDKRDLKGMRYAVSVTA